MLDILREAKAWDVRATEHQDGAPLVRSAEPEPSDVPP